jgi:integrase
VQEAETAGVPVPADGYVFSSDFGYGPLDLYTVSKFVKRVGDKCGIPVHTHSLRHFATGNHEDRPVQCQAIACHRTVAPVDSLIVGR